MLQSHKFGGLRALGLYGSINRQGKAKDAPFSLLALYTNFSAVMFHNFLADSQAQAGAPQVTGAGFVNPVKTFKNKGEAVLRNTASSILNSDRNFIILPLCA